MTCKVVQSRRDDYMKCGLREEGQRMEGNTERKGNVRKGSERIEVERRVVKE